MQPPEPVDVLELFSEDRAALLDLLSGLALPAWELPTACAGWSVKDVALHLLGGDLGNLSRRRDGHFGTGPMRGENIVQLVNRVNEEWVHTTRRLSPRVVCDLLSVSGSPLFAYFSSLDLARVGGPVSWAGPDPAPVWLDVAREYTERWLHQQHIRDAVGKRGQDDARFLGPVLATFAHALPVPYRGISQPPGTAVHLHVDGAAGGDWAVVRDAGGWRLFEGAPEQAAAQVTLDETAAWKLLTRGLRPEEAEGRVAFEGDEQLGRRLLQAVAIIT